MSLSHETPETKEHIRAELLACQNTYQSNPEVHEAVKDKVFVGIAGPFGVGKSTISDKILELTPIIEPILTTTTRARKDEDPEGFKTADEGVTFQSMRQAILSGELVNYSVIPGGDIYGTYPADFPAQHTIGPFLPSSIEHIQKANFERAHFVYLVTAGKLWRGYVETSRRSLPTEKFTSRVDEAISSIHFALSNIEHLLFVENVYGEVGIRSTANKIARLALDNTFETLAPEITQIYLREMLTEAESLKQ